MKKLNEEQIRRIQERRFQNRIRSYKRHLINEQARREKYFAVNSNLQFVETGNRVGSLRNTLRWGANETRKHILKKLEVCMDLKEMNHDFLCEARFKTGGRCDVLDLSTGTVYEVLHTESEKDFEANKLAKYPTGFAVVKVEC